MLQRSSLGTARARPPARPARESGFSLLEVLVAFSILALSLGVLLQIFSSSVNASVRAEARVRAAMLAEVQLNSVGIDIPLEPGETGGEEDNGMRWQVTLTEYLPEPVLEDSRYLLLYVRVQVFWQDLGREQVFQLDSLRLVTQS
jgi:general secretion pathway protein I